MDLVIDDFGTGYSSLSYLARFPVDFLKIDISFVRSLTNEQNRKVVNAILSLAESLDMRVVAEGIENTGQLAYFRERRCARMQGFYFMKALPIGELERQLVALRSRSAAKAAAARQPVTSASPSPRSPDTD
jgi:sensor c-di-GMP phosphodiesterase-like protein